MKELKYYSGLANKILIEDTKYQLDKDIISSIFNKLCNSILETIVFRLTIIDSYYSTQLNKRYFGIEEIAEAVINITDDDDLLAEKFSYYLQNPEPDNDISNLFESGYGYRKNGKRFGVAQSLISKYAYFLTRYKFPIYDKLVKVSYSEIQNLYPELELHDLPKVFSREYFINITNLNKVSDINDYDKLDNLLWLFGKLKEGSFSLILNKNYYLKLVRQINFKNKLKSNQVDEVIRKYIIENINSIELKNIFNDRILEFIKFCLNIV